MLNLIVAVFVLADGGVESKAEVTVNGTIAGDWFRNGHPSVDEVNAEIQRHRSHFDECRFAQRPQTTPLNGDLTVMWVVAADGSTSSVEVKTSTVGEAVTNCVLGQVAQLRFPKPTGGVVRVKYPFFERREAPDAGVKGGLSKEELMTVIKSHQNEIKLCYELALNEQPTLSGKVAVAWVVDAAGAVSDAGVTESTLGDSNVESCILQRIRRWTFPQPHGGGVVNVTFPWIFKPAGQE